LKTVVRDEKKIKGKEAVALLYLSMYHTKLTKFEKTMLVE